MPETLARLPPTVQSPGWGLARGGVCCCVVAQSCPTLATSWTAAPQAPLSMEFPREEHRSGLPFPPAGDLLDPGTVSAALRSPVLAGRFFTTRATWEALGMQQSPEISTVKLTIERPGLSPGEGNVGQCPLPTSTQPLPSQQGCIWPSQWPQPAGATAASLSRCGREAQGCNDTCPRPQSPGVAELM